MTTIDFCERQSQRERIRERLVRAQRPERRRLIMSAIRKGVVCSKIETVLREAGLTVSHIECYQWVKFYRQVLKGEFVEDEK